MKQPRGDVTSKRPDWSILRRDNAAQWRDVGLLPDDTERWLHAITELWTDRGTRTVIAGLWAHFLDAIPALRASVGVTYWEGAHGWDLVFDLESSVAIRLGISRFVPEPYASTFDAGARKVLYVHALMLAAVTELRHLPLRNRVLLPALRAEYFLLAAPHVEREIARRARNQAEGPIGISVALALFSCGTRALLGDGPPDQGEALRRLLEPVLSEHSKLLVPLDPKGRGMADRRAGAMGNRWEGIPQRWRDLDGLPRLEHALNRRFNVLLRAFQYDPVAPRLAPHEGDDSTGKTQVDSLPSAEPPQDQEARAWAFLEAVGATPEGRPIIQAVAESDDETLNHIAERVGASDKTIRSWIEGLKPRVSEFLSKPAISEMVAR